MRAISMKEFRDVISRLELKFVEWAALTDRELRECAEKVGQIERDGGRDECLGILAVSFLREYSVMISGQAET